MFQKKFFERKDSSPNFGLGHKLYTKLEIARPRQIMYEDAILYVYVCVCECVCVCLHIKNIKEISKNLLPFCGK